LGLGIAWYLFRPELLFIDRIVSEEFPATGDSTVSAPRDSTAEVGSRVLARGMFRSVAHSTTGTATIHRLENGDRVLRLTDFATSNGPDVRIVLVAAADANDNATVTQSATIELGQLKGNKGDQNYLLPSGVDLEQYRAVTIWCHRFSVNFGTAPLMRAT
jgi:hypothetical protein